VPHGVDDNEELPLDLTIETKPIFAVGESLIGFAETRGVGEDLACESEVETMVLESLLAFVFIPIKLQLWQGSSTRSFRASSYRFSVSPETGLIQPETLLMKQNPWAG